MFDGHGGDEVAQHCSDRLHGHFTAELMNSIRAENPSSVPSSPASSSLSDVSSSPLSHRFQRTNTATAAAEAAADATGTGNSGSLRCLSGACHSNLISDALRASFHKTDCELAGTDEGEYVGATAVVVVVGKQHIWVAHCGEKRGAGPMRGGMSYRASI